MYPNNIYIKNYNEQAGVLMSADKRLLGIGLCPQKRQDKGEIKK